MIQEQICLSLFKLVTTRERSEGQKTKESRTCLIPNELPKQNANVQMIPRNMTAT